MAEPLTPEEQAVRTARVISVRLLPPIEQVRIELASLHAHANAVSTALDLAGVPAGIETTDAGRVRALAHERDVLRAELDQVRAERDALRANLAELRADAGAVVSDLHEANQLGPCGEVRQAAIECAIAALRAAVLGGGQ